MKDLTVLVPKHFSQAATYMMLLGGEGGTLILKNHVILWLALSLSGAAGPNKESNPLPGKGKVNNKTGNLLWL